MGGDKEAVLPATSKKSGAAGTAGKVRFHESGGEVHFHDDVSKLKCAIPVPDFWAAWHRFKTQPSETIHFSDHANNTEIEIVREYDNPLDPKKVDLRISIAEVTHGTGFEALDKFVTG